MKTLEIAHRGGMKQRNENTLASFQAAIADGFDGIELDVRALKTGEIVVFHDASLQRLTNDIRMVAELTLADLSEITIRGEPIPLLSDVFKDLPKTILIIEIKDPKAIQATAALIAKFSQKHAITVISKQLADLEQVKDLENVERGFIASRHFLPPIAKMRAVKASTFICHQWIVNWFGVRRARRNNIKTIAYPINSKLYDRILRSHQIEGIMYDRNITS